MTASHNTPAILQMIVGLIVGMSVIPLFKFCWHAMTVEVENEMAVLITQFGRLTNTLKEPGLHFFPQKLLPWIRVIPISLHRDFRHYTDIHVNDRRGTSVIVDLWIEFKIVDPERAMFRIEDWEHSLQSLLTHSATSILGTREFSQILHNRTELGATLRADIHNETTRWGLKIEEVFIRSVSLLPEVSRQMFETVAAQLERAKANVEEEGRLRVSLLEAQTQAKVAALVAEAKGQYPAAIGRAYEALAQDPEIFSAYRELYDLTLVRPHRTVAFEGFEDSEIRAIDAAMVVAPMGVQSNSPSPEQQLNRQSS